MTVLSISADRMTELQRETLADTTMQKLAKFIKEGWPGHERSVPPDVKPFFHFCDELVIENDVILKGQKAVVPKSLRSTCIAILHKGHMGADRTKQLASDVVYWPKMRQDIESAVFTWMNKNRVVKTAMLSRRKHIAETHNASNRQTTRSLVDISM